MCKHDLFSIAVENIMSICLFRSFLFLCVYVSITSISRMPVTKQVLCYSSYAIFCWLSFMQLLVYQFWSEIELADVIFKYTEDPLYTN
jgi:hypothetical protein